MTRVITRIAVAAAAVSLLLVAYSPATPAFKATDITGGRMGGGFTLSDHNGSVRRLTDFRGKLVVVFFGYTSCPDVCPTTLSTLAEAVKKLGPDADQVQVLMITVDPARDTRQVMAQYVTSFDSRFIGLIPSEDALRQLAGEFKVFINRNKPDANGFCTVDHSTGSFVFDGSGRIRLLVPHDFSSEDWAADLRALLRQEPSSG